MAGNYLPRAGGAFLEWAKALVAYAEARVGPFNLNEGALMNVKTLLAAYQAAYLKAEEPNRGKVDVLRKNETQAALASALRGFVNTYLTYNPAVTDTDKESMGLPLRDRTRTPVPPPTALAEASLSFPGIHQVELKICPAGNCARTGEGVPAQLRDGVGLSNAPTYVNASSPLPATAGGVKTACGVRIYWGVLDSAAAPAPGAATASDKFRLSAPPASGDDLPHSAFTRKRKHRFDFSEVDRGRRVYFCLRYENSKGEAGPWGPILSAIVP
jgi:hypothetical protein